jgi:hypothetical protein|tara:strand:- start:964 stop:1524 length:561 start_codon:yes stop_codon:yes gene_type:complete
MKEPIKAVMLPTDDITTIEFDEHNQLWYNPDKMTGADVELFQHLYITVPQEVEPIKAGDWFYNSINEYVAKATNRFAQGSQEHRKVIATTDYKIAWEGVDIKGYKGSLNEKSLLVTQPLNPLKKDHVCVSNISHITQVFLKEFVCNPDGEWEVGYYDNDDLTEDLVLKMNPDRSAIINPINKITES